MCFLSGGVCTSVSPGSLTPSILCVLHYIILQEQVRVHWRPTHTKNLQHSSFIQQYESPLTQYILHLQILHFHTRIYWISKGCRTHITFLFSPFNLQCVMCNCVCKCVAKCIVWLTPFSRAWKNAMIVGSLKGNNWKTCHPGDSAKILNSATTVPGDERGTHRAREVTVKCLSPSAKGGKGKGWERGRLIKTWQLSPCRTTKAQRCREK